MFFRGMPAEMLVRSGQNENCCTHPIFMDSWARFVYSVVSWVPIDAIERGAHMSIRIHTEDFLTTSGLEDLGTFLETHALAPKDARLTWSGGLPSCPLPQHSVFSHTSTDPDEVDLEIGFLTDNLARNDALLQHSRAPLFLVGATGLPKTISHVCVPFHGLHFTSDWLYKVVREASRLEWKVRLLHNHHDLIAHEIIRIADWFHLDSVKNALRKWLDDDVKHYFSSILEHFPDTEVKTGIGRLRQLLHGEDPSKTLVMGSLKSGYHLPNRHHGLHYGALLSGKGPSGFFLTD